MKNCTRGRITSLLLILSMTLSLMAAFPTRIQASIRSEVQSYVFQFLTKEMGFSQAAACGVLANMAAESNFDPTCVGDHGTSYGLLQWHDGAAAKRKQRLIDWCTANGYDYTTAEGQMNYLKRELSSNNDNYLWNGLTIYRYLTGAATLPAGSPNAGGYIANTDEGAYQAAWIWCYYYEVPANKAVVSVSRATKAKTDYWPRREEFSHIYALDSEEASVTLSQTVFPYTGKSIKPTVSVFFDLKELTLNTDYTVSYSNNKEPGTATITVNGCGDYYNTQTLTFRIQLGTPTLKKLSQTSSGLKLEWESVLGADGYFVYRKSGSGSWTRMQTGTGNTGTVWYDKTVPMGSTYTYTVVAYRKVGTKNVRGGYDSAGITGTRLATPAMSSASLQASGLKVKWTAVDGADGYLLYRRAGTKGTWTKVTQTDAAHLSYTDTGIDGGTRYYYTVRAISNHDGNITKSGYETIGTSAYFLRRPEITSLVSKEIGQMKLRYSASENCTGYIVDYSRTEDFSKSTVTLNLKPTKLAKTITDLKKGKTYYVRVRSYLTVNGKTLYTKWSPTASIKVLKTLPAPEPVKPTEPATEPATESAAESSAEEVTGAVEEAAEAASEVSVPAQKASMESSETVMSGEDMAEAIEATMEE